MDFVDLMKEIEFSEGGILSKELVKGSELNITLFCMSKGTEISEHTSTRKGFVQVIKGKGFFNLKDREIEMRPWKLIFLDENAVHSLKALENTAFLLVLFSEKKES